jgi:hypothetical protein
VKRLALVAALVAAAVTASAAGAGGPKTLYVSPTGSIANNGKSCAGATYSSIQAAVNASASGGTVVVCPGTYDEQVSVGVSKLTIQGSGNGSSSIIRPTTASPNTVTEASGYVDAPIVYAGPGLSGITLQNLTVDGSGMESNPLFNCTDDLVGVLYQGAAGTMDTLTVVHTNTGSGCGTGLGIEAIEGSSATIQKTTVADYNKNGITCNGAGTACKLDQNTTTGAGPTTMVGQNGIQVGFGATATIDHSSVSGSDYTGATNSVEPLADYAAGILLYAAGGTTTLDHSALTDDQVGLEIVDSNAKADHTTVTQTTGIPNGVGVWDAPCDFYCSFFTGVTPGNVTLSLDHSTVSFAGSPAMSYGLEIGPAWSGDDPDGSAGTVTYHVDHNQISGATFPVVYGPRAVAG